MSKECRFPEECTIFPFIVKTTLKKQRLSGVKNRELRLEKKTSSFKVISNIFIFPRNSRFKKVISDLSFYLS